MVKKLIVTGLFSIISTASFADKPVSLKQDNSAYISQGSAYVGASAGFPTTGINKVYSGDVFAGYGKKFGKSQRIYLGGEITGGVDHYPSHQFNWNAATTSYSMGASVIPGLMLTPTLMAYGRVGIKEYVNHGIYGVSVLGLGLQKDINKNWGVRGEYTRTAYDPSGQANLGVTYKLDK